MGDTGMRRSNVAALCAVALFVMVATGCGSARQPSQAVVATPANATPEATRSALPPTGPGPAATPEAQPPAAPRPLNPDLPAFADFDHRQFSHPTTIDNVWLPLRPGRRWIVDGVTIEDGERIPHRIAFTVTDLTKTINGVDTVVAYVEDFTDGALVEKEIAFYAQDDKGTVWYFGEDPEEYEEGEFVAAPTWLAGIDGARPGIKMFADPSTHTQTYYQGWAPAVEWSDFGRVDETGLEDCVPRGCYMDVVRIAESSDGEAGAVQLKSYARGVGEIRTGWRGKADSREELALKSMATLHGSKLAKIRVLALEMEEHAYVISARVYGQTDPMQ